MWIERSGVWGLWSCEKVLRCVTHTRSRRVRLSQSPSHDFFEAKPRSILSGFYVACDADSRALFTRHKLTRVSFCRVNTANPGSTRVSLEKCRVNTTWVSFCGAPNVTILYNYIYIRQQKIYTATKNMYGNQNMYKASKNIYMATKIYIRQPKIYIWQRKYIFCYTYFGCRTYIFGCRIYIFGCRTYIFGCRIYIFGCRTYIFGCRIYIFGCRTYIFGCRTYIFGCRIYFWLTYMYFLLPYIYSCTILSHLAPHIVLTRVSTRFVPGKQGSGPSQPRICVLICSWSAVLHSCLFDSATIFAGEWELEE